MRFRIMSIGLIVAAVAVLLIVFKVVLLYKVSHREVSQGIIPQVQTPPPQEEAVTIIPIDQETISAQIEYDAQGKFISEWKGEGKEQELVINAGYFHADYSPSGFLVAGGKRIGNRMFDQDKSGLVVIKKGKLTIRNLKREPIKSGEHFEDALQSYPFLIEDGKPALVSDSGHRARRTAIGIDEKGTVYVLMVPYQELSLYEFMQALLKTNVSFTEVLNLDGGPSSGISSTIDAYPIFINSFTKVASVIRFIRR